MPSVLLVDDEPGVLEGLSRILRKAGLRVRTAVDGLDALRTVRTEAIDAIVMDERMPRMSGSEAFAAIALEFPRTVRILLTGHASMEAAIRAINEGRIFRFLEKPVPPSILISAIEAGLASVAAEPAPLREVLLRMAPHPGAAKLTPKELEVLELASRGYRVGRVADMLGRSPDTIRNQIKSICRKMDFHGQADLVELRGILPGPNLLLRPNTP